MQSSPPARRRLQLEALEDRATPAAGALDPTFGGTGVGILLNMVWSPKAGAVTPAKITPNAPPSTR